MPTRDTPARPAPSARRRRQRKTRPPSARNIRTGIPGAATPPPSYESGVPSNTGDAAAARDQFAALLPVRERVQGPEHPDTLAARNQLARWTGEAGDAAGARDQYAALLPVRERVLGPEHPDTLAARNQLAR